MNIAIIGATDKIGREILNIMYDENFSIKNITAVTTDESIEKTISFGNKNIKTKILTNFNFNHIDIAVFISSENISKIFIQKAIDAKCTVINNTLSNQNTPPIVYGVNEELLNNKSNIISNPNCIAIQTSIIVNTLNILGKIEYLNISTYQSTSGIGKKAMDELYIQTKAKFTFEQITPSIFPRPIAFNCIPFIGNLHNNGHTTEEYIIIEEINSILKTNIPIDITCVQVPTFNSHGMTLTIKFKNSVDINSIYLALNENEQIITAQQNKEYVTNIDCIGEDAIFVSRIKQNKQSNNTITMWVITNNLRRGSALNIVQIINYIIKKSTNVQLT